MAIRKISERVFAVGASDPGLKFFDSLMATPLGTTYNSYLVAGDEKTALLDPVQLDCVAQLFGHLAELKIDKIDYIVDLHTEQDHSGSLPLLRERFPDAELVGTGRVAELMELHLHIPKTDFKILQKGEVLALGGVALECIPIPSAHWPDNTMYWLAEGDILFSSDLFGSHYALAEGAEVDEMILTEAIRAYYAEIMMPTRRQVSRHVEVTRKLNPRIICPAHGPIHFVPDEVLSQYESMMSDKVERTVVIPLVSMHGSTRKLVEILADELEKADIAVKVHNLSDHYQDLRVTQGNALADAVNAACVVLASPTVLAGLHPSAASMAQMLNVFKPKNRFFSIVSTFGWGTHIEKATTDLLPQYAAEKLSSLLVKGLPHEEDEKQIREYARMIAAKIDSIPAEQLL